MLVRFQSINIHIVYVGTFFLQQNENQMVYHLSNSKRIVIILMRVLRSAFVKSLLRVKLLTLLAVPYFQLDI